MNLDTFWELIEESRKESSSLDEQMECLKKRLLLLDPGEIIEFDRCFSMCIRDAYRWDLWAVAHIIKGGCSDDEFDSFLGWLITQGRDYFKLALKKPERAGDRVAVGDGVACDEIWNIADRAYEEKTKKADFHKKAQPVERTIKGQPWDEEEVADLFPRLAEKFAK